MSDPVRVLSSAELALLRTDNQFTKVRAVILPQTVVLACKCAETKLSNDAVTTITIGSVTSGSYTKVRNGMTCYVGTEAGIDDLGMVRVKSCTATTLTIARVSGITWTPDVHLTVVDEFGLWAKLPTLDLTTIKMDDDIEYTNQNTYMSPTPVFGVDTAVPLTAGSYVYNAENSYCLDGSSIVNYQWSVYTGGDLVSGSLISCGSASSGSMAFTFPAPGSYTVDLTITSGNGKSTTGHRALYVYDELVYKPIDQIKLDSMRASRDDGGWVCELTAFANAGSAVRDRAKVIVLSQDYYGGSGVSVGQISGSEHVLMSGWISGETIRFTREFSTVKFTVSGANYWLKQVTGPSTFLESVVGEPSAWTSIQNMTMDDVIHHFLYWRSTAIEVMDVYRSLNTRLIGGMSASIGSIWEQIYDTAITRMLTYIAVDRFGRFFSFLDPQVIPDADRTSIPTVQALSNEDMTGDVDMKRTVVNPVSLLEVAGLSQSGSTVLMYMSRAPGSLIYNRFGQNDQNDRLVVSSQNDANSLSGMLLAKKNNEYDSVSIELGQINHFVDIAPAMYLTMTVAATSNARGVYFTEKKMLIKDMDYRPDDKGVVVVNLELEGETTGIPGYTVIMPQEPIYNFPETPDVPDIPGWDIVPPDFPDYPYPWVIPPIYVPPTDPLIGAECRDGTDAYGPYCLFAQGEVLQTSNEGMTIPYPTWMRGAGASGSAISYGGSTVSGSWISGSAFYSGSYISSWQSNNPSRYEIQGSWWKLGSGLTTSPGTVFAGSAVAYGASTANNEDYWYTIEALDSAMNVVATGVHDIVQNPNIRTGTFYKSGSGGDVAYIRIRPVTSQGIWSSGSGMFTINSEAFWWNGASECYGFESGHVSGSGFTNVQFTDSGVMVRGHGVSWSTSTLFPYNPGLRMALYYNDDLGYRYFHVTGSSVCVPNQIESYPECVNRGITFSEAIEGTNWWETSVENPDNYLVDQYLYSGRLDLGNLGYKVAWKVHANASGVKEVVSTHDYTYFIEELPLYKMNITDVCLYNVCAPSGVP